MSDGNAELSGVVVSELVRVLRADEVPHEQLRVLLRRRARTKHSLEALPPLLQRHGGIESELLGTVGLEKRAKEVAGFLSEFGLTVGASRSYIKGVHSMGYVCSQYVSAHNVLVF